MRQRSANLGVKVTFRKGAWWIVVHAQGTRRVKRVGTGEAGRRAAEKAAEELRARLVLGKLNLRPEKTASESYPFTAYARGWFAREVSDPVEHGAEHALSPRSRDLQAFNLRAYLEPFFGNRDLRELRPADVAALRDSMLSKGLGSSSILHALSTLGQILSDAQMREIVPSNAVVAWKAATRGKRRRSTKPHRVRSDQVLDSRELAEFLVLAAERVPDHVALILFLADTGARLGEASALRWIDVDFERGTARVCRSWSNGRYLSMPKTGSERSVELSSRLRDELRRRRPDVFGDETLVFPSQAGGFLDPHNFRDRVFRPLVERAFGRGRRFTVHGLRHTFASLHLARRTPLMWIQAQGGWASPQALLTFYAHFLPRDQQGFADALSTAPDGTQAAPARFVARKVRKVTTKNRKRAGTSVAPRAGFEPATRRLEGAPDDEE